MGSLNSASYNKIWTFLSSTIVHPTNSIIMLILRGTSIIWIAYTPLFVGFEYVFAIVSSPTFVTNERSNEKLKLVSQFKSTII